MHITKILVNSGHSKIFPRETRRPALETDIGVWIETLLRTKRKAALPRPWSGYSATAADFQGGMVLSVYSAETDALVQTIAIARHAAHGRPLWRVISALSSNPGCETPPCKTWCAVLAHGDAFRETELEDFALACAWFWRTHGSKFGRRARSGQQKDEPIFYPSGAAAIDSKDFSGLEVDTRPAMNAAGDTDECHIRVASGQKGADDFLVVEVPHAGGNIEMTVPRSLLELCFSIDGSDPSIDCIHQNMPLFVAAAHAEYRDVSTRAFELTEYHIAGALKNMALREKGIHRSTPSGI